MKALLAVLVLSLGGCAFFEDLFYEDDGFSEIVVPVDTAATIAGQIEDILRTADLDGDGNIQGDEEWLELLLGIYDAVRDEDHP